MGRGPALPVAAEAALKLKETAVLHAEAFSGAEVMHGPLQLLEPGFPVIAFAQADASRDAMRASAARLAAAGGRVFDGRRIGRGADLAAAADRPSRCSIRCRCCSASTASPSGCARARGHDPDRPSHLRKVTETV